MKPKRSYTIYLLYIVLSLIVFSACDEDNSKDDLDYSNIISMKNKGNINTAVGYSVDLKLDVLDRENIWSLELYVGETKTGHTKGLHSDDKTMSLSFIVADELKDMKNVPVTLRLNGKLVADGITITVTNPYLYFYYSNILTVARNPGLAHDGGNEVFTTTVSGFSSDERNVSIKYKKSNGNNFPELDYNYSLPLTFPVSAENARPKSVSYNKKWGYTYKNGTAYIYSLYGDMFSSAKDAHYIVKYKDNETSFFGHESYYQIFKSLINEIQADTENNLYVIAADKPYCIYKINETTPATLWAGSETESGSRDGNKTNARFEEIIGIQIDSKNNLYVAQKSIIRKITPDGTVTTLNNLKFSDIHAIAVAPDNSIYVLDEEVTSIKIINPEQTEVKVHKIKDGFFPEQEKEILNIQNMTVCADGIVYMCFYSFLSGSQLHVLVPKGR